jgi:hypothetical protein
MLPMIMAAISLAQKKAQNENNAINQLSQPVQFNGQPQNRQMIPMQNNGFGNAMSSISSIYGSL